MSETTTLENFTCDDKSSGDKLSDDDNKDQQSRSEFANIYTQLPPCVRKDINARIDRKKLDCGSPEAMKIILHCRDQYIKKRDYNRQLGATVRGLAKAAKVSPLKEPPECFAPDPQAECFALKAEESVESEESAESEEELDKLDAILSEPKKEIPTVVQQQGIPRTAARQINTVHSGVKHSSVKHSGVSKLFKSPDKLRRS
jgi:hypothetical protein